MAIGTHSIFALLEVKGLAIEASALDNEIPAWAKVQIQVYEIKTVLELDHASSILPAFSAPQSFAPSPKIDKSKGEYILR